MKNSAPSVITQIRTAVQPGNRLAALLGALVGAVPPVGSYAIVHHALDARPLWSQPLAYLVGGLMVFSALSVVRWMRAAFSAGAAGWVAWGKALGWTLGIEGLLVGAPPALEWLALVCVGYLVAINAISASCGFVADYEADRARCRDVRKAVRGDKKAKTPIRSIRSAA